VAAVGDAPPYIDPSAEVSGDAVVGPGASVWNWSKVRERAHIGPNCNIGQSVYIDHGVTVGEGCKIQNGVSVYHGVTLGRFVFVGPHVTFTNDREPRAFGAPFTVVPTTVADFASIGANATIVCGATLGRGCMVAAGAVVTGDVPAFALVRGVPARVVDYVGWDGASLGLGPGGPPPDPDQPVPPGVLS
jgi:UDP-2-acetamido-3-amino-2,3-dideoxy-glucuronate N-acetyltransferase